MLLLLIGQALFSQTPETVTIIGTGDMMLGTNYPNKSYLPANGGRDLLRDVVDILKNADVTFGNLEGCMFDGSGTPKRCRATQPPDKKPPGEPALLRHLAKRSSVAATAIAGVTGTTWRRRIRPASGRGKNG